jgi:acyl-coenzyme A thioesterase PaaI-like protein
MSIRFRRPANGGVQAHAEITEEMANAVEEGVARKGRADLDVPVTIYDGQGTVVAEMLATYHFRTPKTEPSSIE